MEWCSMARTLRSVAAIVACLATALVALAPQTTAASPSARPTVVNGVPVSIGEIPWQALLIVGDGDQRALCSGALITPTVIASAAHCLQGVSPGSVKAWLGVSRLSEAKDAGARRVAGIVVHPGFDARSLTNDIALVQLAEPVDLTAGPRLIALPFGQDPATWPAAGSPATISGWGATVTDGRESDQLLRGDVQVLAAPTSPCGQYGPAFNSSSLICGGLPSGAVDTCQGDSGGPFTVVANGVPVLAGLTSNGVECASAVYPGLYTRLTTYLPWIQQSADVPTAAPGQPTGIRAVPRAGKMQVFWTVPAAPGSGSTVWTVTAQPGGRSCQTTGASCEIARLPAGRPVTFTVQGSGPLGAGSANTSEPVQVFTAQLRRGSSVSARTVAGWLGLRGAARAVSRSKGTCSVKANRIRALRAGTCTLVIAASGRRGRAVIAIR